MKVLVVFALLFAAVAGDLYLQNLPGGNNRLNERNANANNQDRLFDSQNNAKGGYAIAPALYFYEGSLLRLEWTNQHGCGNPKLCCNTVLQYMCQDPNEDRGDRAIRNGYVNPTNIDDTNTGRIPNNNNNGVDDPATDTVWARTNGILKYGMHESYASYQACQKRERQKGLFHATQNLNGNDATKTRQNNNGNRRGLECPEERDYWPYWAPSSWVDIAVFTDDPDTLCSFFQSNSENVKPRAYCKPPETATPANGEVPVTETGCIQKGGGYTWVKSASFNKPKPDCLKNRINLDNHLGNIGGRVETGYANYYNWIIPDEGEKKCVFRIRYNITTSDITTGDKKCNQWFGDFIDSKKDGAASPVKNNPTATVAGAPLRLAIDTSQFGRTFQDRSHIFNIKPRPDDVPAAARVYNFNVRGKRGNIVQTFPSTEYDYTPEDLEVRPNDYLHFQFTGSIYNPQDNAGEGRAGTDASNIVQIEDLGHSYPARQSWLAKNPNLFRDDKDKLRFASLAQTGCKSAPEGQRLNQNDLENCMKLNRPGSNYYDGGLYQMKTQGRFDFMSTRNNNFTNRGQKGTIFVKPLLPVWAIVLVAIGGAFFLGAAAVAGLAFYAKTHPHSGVAQKYTLLTSKI